MEDTPAARSDYAETAPIVAEVQQYEPVPVESAAVEQVESMIILIFSSTAGREIGIPLEEECLRR